MPITNEGNIELISVVRLGGIFVVENQVGTE